MLLLSSTVASCYYNYCTDGRTNPRNNGYPSYDSIVFEYVCKIESGLVMQLASIAKYWR
jgi:hypothetical protein